MGAGRTTGEATERRPAAGGGEVDRPIAAWRDSPTVTGLCHGHGSHAVDHSRGVVSVPQRVDRGALRQGEAKAPRRESRSHRVGRFVYQGVVREVARVKRLALDVEKTE